METNTIKLEISDVCKGCLSTERNLQRLTKECAQIYYNMLGEELVVFEDSMCLDVTLCWECIAILQKILMYQKRFRTAHIILLGKWTAPYDIKSLSNLTCHYKNNYNSSLQYNDEEHENIKMNTIDNDVVDLKIKLEVKEEGIFGIKEEISNDFVSDNNMETDVLTKKKRIYTKKRCGKVFERTIVNYDEFNEHFNNVSLNFERIKDIIDDDGKMAKRSMLAKTHDYFLKTIDMMHLDLDKKDARGVECPYCEKYLSNRLLLKKHWNEHTIDLMKCSYCDVMSIHKSEMVYHLKSSHKYNLKCECGFECRSRKEYYQHYNTYHRLFVCDVCQSRYRVKEKIERHMLNKHIPYKCDMCERSYKNRYTLKIHCLVNHKDVVNENTNELKYCVECDMHFENNYLYKRHLRTAVAHNPKRPTKVPCPDCGKIFSRSSYMKNHYNLVHKQQSKYYCEICDKYFSCGYAIRTHKKFVHLKEEKKKDKFCKICGRGFCTNRVLNNHIRTHTGEKPYECSFCSAAFAQHTTRKTHEQTQHINLYKEIE